METKRLDSITELTWHENMAVSRKNVTQKRRGRPATGQDPHVSLRLPVETIAAADAWAAQQPDKPTRSEALRRLIDLGMKAAPARGPARKR
jgi:hypothetical protein